MGFLEEEGFKPPPVLNVAIEELTKGCEYVVRLNELLLLLDSPENFLSTARLLTEEIKDRICKAKTILESGKRQDNMVAHVDSHSDVTSKGPGGKRKMQSSRKTADRKRGHPYSWTRVTSATTEDGRTWRKYGQKEIFSAKHPRNYYRCTHKYDKGCKATRQVQKSEDDPLLYVITYFGEHTCEGASQNITYKDPCIISFKSNATSCIKPETPFSSFPTHKQESEEEVHSNLTCSGSSSDYFVSPEVELQKASMVELETTRSESSSGLQSSITNYDLEFSDLEDILSLDYEFFEL